jgi:hypothetical protein
LCDTVLLRDTWHLSFGVLQNIVKWRLLKRCWSRVHARMPSRMYVLNVLLSIVVVIVCEGCARTAVLNAFHNVVARFFRLLRLFQDDVTVIQHVDEQLSLRSGAIKAKMLKVKALLEQYAQQQAEARQEVARQAAHLRQLKEEAATKDELDRERAEALQASRRI